MAFLSPPSSLSLRSVCRACHRSSLKSLRSVRSHRSYTQGRLDAASLRLPTSSRIAALGVTFGTGAACFMLWGPQLHAEEPEEAEEDSEKKNNNKKKKGRKVEIKPTPVEATPEEIKNTDGLSKEETRDLISNQHQQVRHSLENPGVYAWGWNAGRVAAPDSDEPFIKTPRRITFFDGLLLRDLKLGQKFGAAITEKGDLLQWGTEYDPEAKEPALTLKGKNLVSVELSEDRVIALSSSGIVYSIPASKEDQRTGHKPSESSWIPFWPSRSRISYRTIKPPLHSFPWTETVTQIASGLSHVVLLTSRGRVFTAAASSTTFPSSGQLGVPGLTWTTRPAGAYDQPHELVTLYGFAVKSVAAGDNHSLALDSAGRVFAFGDNAAGQLGLPASPDTTFVDAPSLLPFDRTYAGSGLVPRVTGVAAGGSTSFFTVDATRVAQPSDDVSSAAVRARLGRVSADTWACGSGILGSLGNGRWTHNQFTPAKVKAMSGLFEWDEVRNRIIPIRIHSLSVGATHAAATLANVTYLEAGKHTGRNDTNWGADVLWWGGNEYWQLGTGKRNNVSLPTYIGTLDGEKELGSRREEHRFHATPRTRTVLNGRWVSMEQWVHCGRGVSAVYSRV